MCDSITTEEWKSIPGYEGLYEASSFGMVRSLPRRKTHGRVLKPHFDRYGYGRVALSMDSKPKTWKRATLVALAFHGPRPEGMIVRHLDNDTGNDRPENLEWATQSVNMFDRVAAGTHPFANKTHCPQGHPYDEENTRLYQGRRYCRQCLKDRYDLVRRDRVGQADTDGGKSAAATDIDGVGDSVIAGVVADQDRVPGRFVLNVGRDIHVEREANGASA
jgi:hypothetical protein